MWPILKRGGLRTRWHTSIRISKITRGFAMVFLELILLCLRSFGNKTNIGSEAGINNVGNVYVMFLVQILLNSRPTELISLSLTVKSPNLASPTN